MAPRKWTAEELLDIYRRYIKDETVADIAKRYNTTKNAISKLVNKHFNALQAAKYKKDCGNKYTLPPRELILQSNPCLRDPEFTDLLSEPEEELTQNEQEYCWVYVTSKSYMEAIVAAGLNAGLDDKDKRYITQLRLRIMHLQSKQNIRDHISYLETDSVSGADVNKDFLQKQIMLQLQELEEDKSKDGQKLSRDYIQMLGRTFGGFTEKVEIGVVDHSRSVQTLAEAQQKMDTLEELKKQKQQQKKEEEEFENAARKQNATAQGEAIN